MLKLLGPAALTLLVVSGCAHQPTAARDPAPRSHTADSSANQAQIARAYLEITLKVDPSHRPAAAGIYAKYKQPFLHTVPGAVSKQLLVRDEDVVVLHGFDTTQHASEYLQSSLFNDDVVIELRPLLSATPDVRIYATPLMRGARAGAGSSTLTPSDAP